MSQRDQHAFTRNHTLQRQLEDKYLTLRRSFKHTRRRNDNVEEECLASLYKLLLFAKEKQQDVDVEEPEDEENIPKRPHSVVDKPKTKDTVRKHQRPATAIAAKTYKQSYSFAKSGLDIQKSIRDRYLRSKKEKEMAKEPFFKIERLETKRDRMRDMDERPMTTVPTTDETEFEGPSPRRPKTAQVDGRGNRAALTRPQIKITLPSTEEAAPSATTFPDVNPVPLDAVLNFKDDGNLRYMVKSISGQGRRLPLKQPINNTNRHNTSPTAGNQSLSGRVGDETTNDRSTTRAESRTYNFEEEDLIPLSNAEQRKFDEICARKSASIHSRSTPTSRTGFQGVTRQAVPAQNDENLLQRSSIKTQTFLTQYSKKSKLVGYVVKTRVATLAQRDRIMSFRSPCISYQELASIKAGIKQHTSKTRSLVQRSAKLSIYVDKLANGSLLRQHLKELKETKASTN